MNDRVIRATPRRLAISHVTVAQPCSKSPQLQAMPEAGLATLKLNQRGLCLKKVQRQASIVQGLDP